MCLQGPPVSGKTYKNLPVWGKCSEQHKGQSQRQAVYVTHHVPKGLTTSEPTANRSSQFLGEAGAGGDRPSDIV